MIMADYIKNLGSYSKASEFGNVHLPQASNGKLSCQPVGSGSKEDVAATNAAADVDGGVWSPPVYVVQTTIMNVSTDGIRLLTAWRLSSHTPCAGWWTLA